MEIDFMILKSFKCKNGFTVIEVMVTLLVILIVAFGIQTSILATITAKNVNDKISRADDLVSTTLNMVVKNLDNFDSLYVLVKNNPQNYFNTPVEIELANTFDVNYKQNNPINADSLMNKIEEEQIYDKTKKIDNAKLILYVYTVKVQNVTPEEYSQTKLLLKCETQFKLKKDAKGFIKSSSFRMITKKTEAS